eukprot:jgi/Botrbrau1/18548/Bobra.0367s0001.1
MVSIPKQRVILSLLWKLRNGLNTLPLNHFQTKCIHFGTFSLGYANASNACNSPARLRRMFGTKHSKDTEVKKVESNSNFDMRDTIAAISSGSGKAGVGVFRISGPRAGNLVLSVRNPHVMYGPSYPVLAWLARVLFSTSAICRMMGAEEITGLSSVSKHPRLTFQKL